MKSFIMVLTAVAALFFNANANAQCSDSGLTSFEHRMDHDRSETTTTVVLQHFIVTIGDTEYRIQGDFDIEKLSDDYVPDHEQSQYTTVKQFVEEAILPALESSESKNKASMDNLDVMIGKYRLSGSYQLWSATNDVSVKNKVVIFFLNKSGEAYKATLNAHTCNPDALNMSKLELFGSSMVAKIFVGLIMIILE